MIFFLYKLCPLLTFSLTFAWRTFVEISFAILWRILYNLAWFINQCSFLLSFLHVLLFWLGNFFCYAYFLQLFPHSVEEPWLMQLQLKKGFSNLFQLCSRFLSCTERSFYFCFVFCFFLGIICRCEVPSPAGTQALCLHQRSRQADQGISHFPILLTYF